MANEEVVWCSASELVGMVVRREVSPVEILQAHLDRIQAAEPVLHSFITVAADQAMDQARAAEHAVTQGRPLGALHGIPVALKDEMWTKDITSTGGSLAFGRLFPERDGTVAERLKAAGAVIVGKTNLSEFGSWSRSKSRLAGETVNPWDPTRISGASSGGSAACVAAGLAPLAVGSDGGGSVRIPSSLCGVFGLYPTAGRVPCYGSFSYSTGGSLGPIARTVGDAALLQSIIAGPDARDGWALLDPPPDVLAGLGGGVRGLRVGWSPDFGHIAVQEGVALAVSQAMSTLSELGAVVELVDVRLGHPWGDAQARAIFQAAVAAEDWDSRMREPGDLPKIGSEETWMWSTFSEGTPLTHSTAFRTFCRAHLDLLAPCNQLAYGAPPTAADPEAKRRRDELGGAMTLLFDNYDVVCSPTMPVVAPVVPDGWRTPYDDPFMGTNFVFLANATGCTAASVPCGQVEGLPVGLQVIGRPGEEGTVLRVCQAFESANKDQLRPGQIWP